MRRTKLILGKFQVMPRDALVCTVGTGATLWRVPNAYAAFAAFVASPFTSTGLSCQEANLTGM